MNDATASAPSEIGSSGLSSVPPASVPPPDSVPPASVPAWRRYASLAGAFVLGAVLLFAGWAKALDPLAFAQQIREEGLEIVLPAAAVALLALAIEFFLGTALVLGVRNRWILWASTALVAFFVFLTGRTYWNALHGIFPESANCGCFGRMVERTPAEAFWQDLLLLVPWLALAWLARSRGDIRWRLAVATVVTVGLTVFAWRSPDLPLDDYVTALKPGVTAKELCAGNAEHGARTCLDVIVPELAIGKHLVVIADLASPEFASRVPELNEFRWLEGAPFLWVLSSATEDQLFQFRFGSGPSFEIREAPAPLLSTLYRRLPRSFLVESGKVVETFDGLPPFDRWRTKEQ